MEAPQRLATLDDVAQITALMRASIADLFPAYYDDPRQVVSAIEHVGSLDVDLVRDGTYFVHEARGEIVACGGWSRRDKLYAGSDDAGDDRLLDPATEPARVRAMFVRSDWTRRGLGRAILEACERAAAAEGFSRLALMATLPGEPLYRAYGFQEVERVTITTPDGVQMEGVAMERPIRVDVSADDHSGTPSR